MRGLRFQTLIMVSLLASFPVAFVGTIGFIGLVGPHIARMLIGEDQRFFLPASLLTGALILSASSVVSKTLIPGAIFPIGVVTSLIGVPFFISLILGGKKKLMVSLQLKDLGARYGQRTIIRDVNTAAFVGGQVVAVVGPNAAGKSTLFKRMAGLIDGPGEVLLQGSQKGAQAISYMPQGLNASARLTVYESVLLAAQTTDAGVGGARRRTEVGRRNAQCPGHHRPGLSQPR